MGPLDLRELSPVAGPGLSLQHQRRIFGTDPLPRQRPGTREPFSKGVAGGAERSPAHLGRASASAAAAAPPSLRKRL